MTTMTYEEAVFLQGRRKYFDAGNRCNKRDIEGRRKKDFKRAGRRIRERDSERERDRDRNRERCRETGKG